MLGKTATNIFHVTNNEPMVELAEYLGRLLLRLLVHVGQVDEALDSHLVSLLGVALPLLHRAQINTAERSRAESLDSIEVSGLRVVMSVQSQFLQHSTGLSHLGYENLLHTSNF